LNTIRGLRGFSRIEKRFGRKFRVNPQNPRIFDFAAQTFPCLDAEKAAGVFFLKKLYNSDKKFVAKIPL
jgi:hypothetical protein